MSNQSNLEPKEPSTKAIHRETLWIFNSTLSTRKLGYPVSRSEAGNEKGEEGPPDSKMKQQCTAKEGEASEEEMQERFPKGPQSGTF